MCVFSPSPSHHLLISHLTQVCDGTKTVIVLACELLKQAENLLIMGLHPSEIINGYEVGYGIASAVLRSTFLLLPFFLPYPFRLIASFLH